VGNVYIILKQIYSGNGAPNFIRIARVLKKILQETFWSLFSGHTVQMERENVRYLEYNNNL